jgi:hypothetical protein
MTGINIGKIGTSLWLHNYGYEIPALLITPDPGRIDYRQANALGEEHKHWFRAKFFQQYRLFSVTTRKARLSFM